MTVSEEVSEEFEEKVIKTDRVRKTIAGGQVPSFRAVVALGDRKGMIGVGVGKARQTPDAIGKGRDAARKNMVLIPLIDSTIPHEAEAKVGGVRVMLKPASRGTGVVAGVGVREVLEVAGIRDVLSKSFGSKNRLNRATATFAALKQLRGPAEIARLRGKTLPGAVPSEPEEPEEVEEDITAAEVAD